MLRFGFEYTPRLAVRLESDPIIHFVLSSDVGHARVSCATKWRPGSGPVRGTVVMPLEPSPHRPGGTEMLSKASEDAARRVSRLNSSTSAVAASLGHEAEASTPFVVPNDALISAYVFVTGVGPRGQLAGNQAGAARVFMATVARASPGSVALDLRTPEPDSFSKGTLVLTFGRSPVEPPPRGGHSAVLFADNGALNYHNPGGRESIDSCLLSYAEKCIRASARLGCTWEAMSSVRAPFFRFCGFSLPGVCFSRVSRPRSSEEFWLNLTRIAARRVFRGARTLEAAEAALGASSDADVARVLAVALSVYSNYCAYLLDKVVSQDGRDVFVESFDPTMPVKGNAAAGVPPGYDCEDGTLAAALDSLEIRNGVWKHPLLRRLAAVRKRYVYAMALMGVTLPKLQGADRGGAAAAPEDVCGHMAGVLVPLHRLAAEFEKHRPGSWDFPALGPLEEGEAARSLVKLTVETTNVLDPHGGYPSPADSARYVCGGACAAAFDGVKREIRLPRGQPNAFYRAVQSAFVVDMHDSGCASSEVQFVSASGGTCSVEYNAFVESAGRVGAYLMPEPSEGEREAMEHVMKYAFPVPAYKDPSRWAHARASHPLLEGVRRACASAGRNREGTYAIDRCDVVDLYLCETQVTRERMSAWRDSVVEKTRIVEFEYHNEQVTEGVGGYLCRFYVEKR